MKEYRDNINFNRQKKRTKPKRRFRNVAIALFLILLCYVTLLATNLSAGGFPLSTDNAINTSFNSATVDNMRENTSGEQASGVSTNNSAGEAAWNLILVNRWNPIPNDYEVELTELANGQLVDKRIYPALQDMLDDARGEGVYPVVVSGYRSANTQQRILDEKIAEYRAAGCSAEEAKSKAEAWVAIPGTSEHQLGIAVDINADGIRSAGYEVYDWLNQNAHEYGFICRYFPDKTEITGVIGEAWHYRYVGVEAATEIYSQGICLEEYLSQAN